MPKSYWEVCDRWLDRVLGRTDRPNYTNHRMPCGDDAIFSYGSHFELVVVSRNAKGEPRALILNGDRSSVTTTRHQSIVRDMAARSGLPHVIVPFEALSAAGIDPADVEIIDVTADRTEVKVFTRHGKPPAGTFWGLRHDEGWIDVDTETIEQRLDADLVERIDKWHQARTDRLASCTTVSANPFVAIAAAAAAKVFALWSGVTFFDRAPASWEFGCSWRSTPNMSLWDEPFPTRFTAHELDMDKYGGWSPSPDRTNPRWRQDFRRAQSSVALMSGAFGNTREANWHVEMNAFGFEPKREAWSSWNTHTMPAIESATDGMRGVAIGVGATLMSVLTGTPVITYTRERRRHWLGGSLLRAKIRWTTRPICKTCGGTATSMSVEEFDAELARRVAARPTAYADDIRWELRAEGRCPDCTAGHRFRRNSRTAYFISDFDANEPRPLYFFCELPRRAKPTSLPEAIEALKPEPVLLAEQIDRRVLRQGDVFAIELPTKTRAELRKQGAQFERMGPLLGTNHVATEVARMPDGTTLVRGTMHHKPEWRRPDHVRLKLGDGKTWHAVVKNTVPVAA